LAKLKTLEGGEAAESTERDHAASLAEH
jgi:hypothetical protein